MVPTVVTSRRTSSATDGGYKSITPTSGRSSVLSSSDDDAPKTSFSREGSWLTKVRGSFKSFGSASNSKTKEENPTPVKPVSFRGKEKDRASKTTGTIQGL